MGEKTLLITKNPTILVSGVNFFENMVLLEGDQFLSRLTLMFDKARSKGHVQLTMKRYDAKPSQLQVQKIKRMSSKVQRQSRDQNQRPRITQIQNSCVSFEQIIGAKKLVQWSTKRMSINSNWPTVIF